VNDGFDVNDEIDDPANDLPDTDGTEDVNYRDLDDDGDGTPTEDEDADGDGDPTNDDTDGDGTPDYLDPDDVPMFDVVDASEGTDPETSVNIDICVNESGVPNDGLLTFTDASNGLVERNDGGTPNDLLDDFMTYTPNEGFSGTDTFEYTVCDILGNCDTALVTIVINEPQILDIEVNQIVSPNADGKNDFLFIRGVENIRNSTLKIFNRWGVAVYEGKDYNNQNNVFDGRSRGRSTLSVEDYLPSGVYYYIFDYTTLEGVSKVDSEYLYISR
jgi:gliding motility-associated-like protein